MTKNFPCRARYDEAHSMWDIVGPTTAPEDKQYSILDELTEQEAQAIVMALNNYYAGNDRCCRARDIEYVEI